MIIKVLIDDEIHQVEQKPGESILDTLIRNDVSVPYSCRLGYCSVCKCRLESAIMLYGNQKMVMNFLILN